MCFDCAQFERSGVTEIAERRRGYSSVSVLSRMSLVAIPALFLLAGCGGDDDNSAGVQGPGSSGSSSSSSSNSPSSGSGSSPGSGNNSSSSSNSGLKVTIPEIKDGTFQGKVHVEVSGDKDFKGDIPSVGGLTLNGLTLLNFSDNDRTISLVFQQGSKDDRGGMTFSSKEIATADGWGEHCSVTVEESGGTLKGDFSCAKLDAADPRSPTKAYKIKMTGNFSMQRDKQ
jgi:hypothetical protein